MDDLGVLALLTITLTLISLPIGVRFYMSLGRRHAEVG